jgi:hypothetical protein
MQGAFFMQKKKGEKMDILKVDGGPLYQWDKGRRLKIFPVQNCTIEKVHFVNPDSDTAMVVKVVTEGGRMFAPIPNILLTYQWDIKAYAVMTTAEGDVTVCKDMFNIRKKQKPADYVYTETEVINIESVVENAFIKAKAEFDKNYVPRMRNIDQKRIEEYEEDGGYYFSENNWKAFIGDEASGKFGCNRAYVERSQERGTYGMYALSYNADPIYNAWYSKAEWAERFAKEHPGESFREPYDNEYPLLDSIVQRCNNGAVMVRLVPADNREAVSLYYLTQVNNKLEKKFAELQRNYEGMLNEVYAGTEGLAYELSADGTYYICTGRGDVPQNSDIEIAGYIEGLPVEEIAEYAFNATPLKSVRIPTTLNRYGYNAFGWAGSVGAVYVKDLAKWAASRFESSSTPVTAATIPPKVYIKGRYLTDLVIPEGVNEISKRAFMHWKQFKSLVLPHTVTKLDEMAFQYCQGLESVTIPASVKTVGASAFGLCTALKTVTFEGKPDYLAATTFERDTELTDIYVPWSADEIAGAPWGASRTSTIHYDCNGTKGLSYKLSSDGSYAICTGIGTATATNIVIGSMYNDVPVTEVGENAFYYCDDIISIVMDNNIKRIGNSAFDNCKKLKNICIPEGVTIIGARAFAACYELTNFITPNSVVNIMDNAFWNSGLTSITLGNGLKNVADTAFKYCQKLVNIDCDWVEGTKPEVEANAPWGAKYEIIHYKAEV